VSSPLQYSSLLSTLASDLPPSPISHPLDGAIRAWGENGGGWWHLYWQQHIASYVTTMPSAAGRSLPPLRSVTSRLLELYQECVDNGGWIREQYDVRSGMDKLTFFRKIPTAASAIAPPPPSPRHPRCLPGEKRHPSERRQPERKCVQSQILPPPPASADDGPTMAAATPTSTAFNASNPVGPVLPLPGLPHHSSILCHPRRHSQKRRYGNVQRITVKLHVLVAGLMALPKKRQIPQLNSCSLLLSLSTLSPTRLPSLLLAMPSSAPGTPPSQLSPLLLPTDVFAPPALVPASD
jgi:hypothetical protein